jgi:hypothetical protein
MMKLKTMPIQRQCNKQFLRESYFPNKYIFHVRWWDNIINKELMCNSEEHFNDNKDNNLVCAIDGSVHSQARGPPAFVLDAGGKCPCVATGAFFF